MIDGTAAVVVVDDADDASSSQLTLQVKMQTVQATVHEHFQDPDTWEMARVIAAAVVVVFEIETLVTTDTGAAFHLVPARVH